ncbi:Uma2 family endonuclease [Leptolyngbya sp. NK1-12]|uniref:Uma2 family endonuclease n=1 Tax=Leptolyngbya sp. NK1-12 TaxID=2547451 RepID=A0AA96WC47_9CYAN|nr:Uma2 family endonuclease [Leptolyngbya sp. NK1-12]WNZ22493.1 Uma2 family endonuclease [Leptolyngbya sp. NK1-12]
MTSQLQPVLKPEITYPESDGRPMSDNTKQFRWIVVIQQNLEWLFAAIADVFVAGDLLWYPVEGDNKTCQAPDVMVVFGRPKGDRGSYRQWEEGNIAPQVVFEILSPSNTQTEMNKKLVFYNRYGVEEYYLYDPDKKDLSGWCRKGEQLDIIDPIDQWTSPRLGIRFDLSGEELQIYRPDGKRFLTYVEIAQQAEQAEQQLEQTEQQLEQERQRAERLAAHLRSLGIDPDQV